MSLDAFALWKQIAEPPPKPTPSLLCSVNGRGKPATTPRRPGTALRFCAQHADSYD